MEEKREEANRGSVQHVHDYFGRTSVDRGHFHTFTGSTNVETYAGSGHTHNYANETRVADNHIHRMSGVSSLPVQVMMGHVHHLQGVTTVDDNHSHTYDLYTGYPRAPRNVRRGKFFGSFSAKDESGEKQEGGEAVSPLRPRRRLRVRNRQDAEQQ